MNHQIKKTLRAECLAARQALSPEKARAASAALAGHLLQIIPDDAKIVAGYSAIRGEIDVFPALEKLAARGHALCLPVIFPSPRRGEAGRGASGERSRDSCPPPNLPPMGGGILVFRRWQPGQLLVNGKYGVQAPPENEPELTPDVLIVPLLAFDAAGHRLGYGAGYYDRAIAALRAKKQVRAIGAAYSMQRVNAIPAEAHDQLLDAVVTEEGIIGIGE